MNNPWFVTSRQAGVINRFHSKRLLFPQTIAEHCYHVATLAMELSQNVEEINRERILLYSINHDSAEVFTSDVSGACKAAYPELKKTLDEIEKTWIKENCPQYIQDSFIYLNQKEKLIVKIADLTDGLYTSLVEMRMGNETLKPAIEQIWNALVEKWVQASTIDLTVYKNTDTILQWLEREYEVEIDKSIDFDEESTWEIVQ